MRYVSYTELRGTLRNTGTAFARTELPLVVMRRGGESVVMLSLAEYETRGKR